MLLMKRAYMNDSIRSLLAKPVDPEKSEDVKSLLEKFISTENYPALHYSKIKGTKYYSQPANENLQLNEFLRSSQNDDNLDNEEEWEEMQARFIKKLETIEKERKQIEKEQGRIKTLNIKKGKIIKDDDLYRAIEILEDDYVTFNITERFSLLKEQLWAFYYIMKRRQKVNNNNENEKNEIVKDINNKKRKIYKIDFDLLEKRQQLSETEILERRYNIINGKPA